MLVYRPSTNTVVIFLDQLPHLKENHLYPQQILPSLIRLIMLQFILLSSKLYKDTSSTYSKSSTFSNSWNFAAAISVYRCILVITLKTINLNPTQDFVTYKFFRILRKKKNAKKVPNGVFKLLVFFLVSFLFKLLASSQYFVLEISVRLSSSCRV
jgi:hypothetical protein